MAGEQNASLPACPRLPRTRARSPCWQIARAPAPQTPSAGAWRGRRGVAGVWQGCGRGVAGTGQVDGGSVARARRIGSRRSSSRPPQLTVCCCCWCSSRGDATSSGTTLPGTSPPAGSGGTGDAAGLLLPLTLPAAAASSLLLRSLLPSLVIAKWSVASSTLPFCNSSKPSTTACHARRGGGGAGGVRGSHPGAAVPTPPAHPVTSGGHKAGGRGRRGGSTRAGAPYCCASALGGRRPSTGVVWDTRARHRPAQRADTASGGAAAKSAGEGSARSPAPAGCCT
jgi:hypothetical protein